jgi:hypothetical protein
MSYTISHVLPCGPCGLPSQNNLVEILLIFLGIKTFEQTSLGTSKHFSTGTRLGISMETSLHSFFGVRLHCSIGAFVEA